MSYKKNSLTIHVKDHGPNNTDLDIILDKKSVQKIIFLISPQKHTFSHTKKNQNKTKTKKNKKKKTLI